MVDSMLLAATALLLAALPECVPMRWQPAAPASLELLANSPVNCLLLEEAAWTRAFAQAAHARNLTLLGVVRDGRPESAAKALAAGLDGIAAEGPPSAALRDWARQSAKPLVEILPRASLPLDTPPAVLATSEGLWPGIRVEKAGHVEARPTSGPWIDTNSGFLRFLRAAAPQAAIWIANRVPSDPPPAPRYRQAIADAAMAGARWVLDLHPLFWQALDQRDPKALAAWSRIHSTLKFYQDHRALCRLPGMSGLALVQDASTGALVSGGIADMIAAKHVPLAITPPSRLSPNAPAGLQMLLTIDPASLTPAQRDAARNIARRGATIVNGPPGWKMELPPPGRITFTDQQVKQLDEIWREINGLIGRRNFAVRVFGAPGMLSDLKGEPGQPQAVLFLVNYTDYAVENITLHFTSRLLSARLLTPRGSQPLEVYEAEEGSGVDIDKVEDAALVLLEEAPAQPKR
jgi:hypothetical protein